MSVPNSNQPALPEPSKPAVKASRQGLICMWHGLTISGLCSLIGKKPRTSWRYLPRWITILFISAMNSFYGALEKLFFGRRVARTEFVHPPVFILGHWRSGTTMLHNLMSLDPQVTFPNLYQCVNPGHFLLTERILAPLTKRFLPKTRPMDNITAGWDEPQEEDIALALDCLISPYLMTAFSDRREIYERYFDPRDMTESERTLWKQSFLRLLKKITYRKNSSIVTKTPAHTFRISTLLEMFPDARFVYIKRDPYAVYQSTLHLRKTMFTENSLGPPEFSSNEEDTLYFYEKCIRTYEETKGLIPEGRLHEIRFEDLELDPLGQIHQIYQTLSLPDWDLVKPKIEAQLPALKAYRKNAFRMDEATMQRVHSRLKWVFDLYGYPSHLGR